MSGLNITQQKKKVKRGVYSLLLLAVMICSMILIALSLQYKDSERRSSLVYEYHLASNTKALALLSSVDKARLWFRDYGDLSRESIAAGGTALLQTGLSRQDRIYALRYEIDSHVKEINRLQLEFKDVELATINSMLLKASRKVLTELDELQAGNITALKTIDTIVAPIIPPADQLRRLHQYAYEKIHESDEALERASQVQVATLIVVLVAIGLFSTVRLLKYVTRTLTALIKTQDDLQESEKKLRLINARIPGVLYQLKIDVNGNRSMPYVSPTIETFFGISATTVIGNAEEWFALIHPDDLSEMESSIVNSMHSLCSWEWEGRCIRNDGEIRWMRGTSTPEKQKDGSIIWDGMFVDVTERKIVEQELDTYRETLEELVKQRTKSLEEIVNKLKLENASRLAAEQSMRIAKNDAERANKMKSEFLGRMSHELRTPMNAILGFGQLMEESRLDAEQDDCLGEIMHAANHLLVLIDEVLDLAKVESGKVNLKIENIELASVISECLMLVKVQAEKRNIIVENFFTDENIFVKADRTRLKEILLNLLSNAVKYNKESGRITINVVKQGEEKLRLQIIDTGSGLSEEQQQVMFEPFARMGAEYTDVEGTGIGLTITKQLIEMMGGAIGVESKSDEGSTFWVELPRVKISAEELASEDQKQLAITSKTFKAKILYVEDNPANLRLVEKVLMGLSGVSLLSAPNAELGIELARHMLPDLIIMDLNLPGMDGYEALSRLRNFPETCDIPVIALSAAAMPRDIERGLLAGFKRYVTKPIQIDALREVLQVALIDESGDVRNPADAG